MSGDWDFVDDSLYAKKTRLCTFDPELPVGLRANMVALGDFGGPIAVVPTNSGGVSGNSGDEGTVLYTGAGRKYSASRPEKAGLPLSRQLSDGDTAQEVVCVGWTKRLSLVVLLRGGSAAVYRGPADTDPQTVELAEFPPGDVVQVAVVQGNCLALLTSSLQLFVSSNLESSELYCVRYPDPPLDQTRPPSNMLILPTVDMYAMDDDCLEIMIPLYPAGVVLMNSVEAKGQLSEWNNAPIALLGLHPDQDKVLVCTETMHVSVLSLDFETKFFAVDLGDVIEGMLTPAGIGWCGVVDGDMDAGLVVMTFRSPSWSPGGGGAIGVAASGETVTWEINMGQGDALALVQERDAVRVVTAEEHVRLEVVPPSSVALFSVASTDPVAMLKEAWEALSKGDPHADDGLALLLEMEQLEEAVEHCIEAALFAFEPAVQTALLSAAAYGARATENASDLNETVMDACTTLRVLNILREGDAGMSLTAMEYELLTPEVLVDRLLLVNLHKLANDICTHVRMPKDNVVIHWICRKLETSPIQAVSDGALMLIIEKKLASFDSVSVSSIAQVAHSCGRRELALKIMEREPLAQGKVLSLLSMGEHAGAVQCAMDSHDTELVYFALFQSKESLTFAEFFHLVARVPGVAPLMIKFWKANEEHETLMKYLSSQSNHEQSGKYFIEEADKRAGVDIERAGFLQMATNAFKKAAAEVSGAEKARLAALEITVADRKQLETFQNRLSSSLIGRSLHRTVLDAVCRQQIPMSEDIAKQFNLPSKAYNLCVVKGLVKTHAWDALEKLSQTRKMVKDLTIRPFVEECIKEGARDVALKITIASTDKKAQMECFILLQIWEEAGELAIELDDEKALQIVLNSCKNAALANMLMEKNAKAERKSGWGKLFS